MKKEGARLSAELAVYLILLYAIHSFVFMYGDDFVYAAFGVQGIFKNALNSYFICNGRVWVNFVDSFLLLFGRSLYIAINPLLIMLFFWLLAKNVQVIAGCEDKTTIMRQMCVSGVFFACLDMLSLRETVFWISGMTNYLLPAISFLLCALLFQYALAGRIKGWQWAPYCLACLWAGSSVEQYALMSVGFMTILLAVDLFKKKKHAFQIYIGYALAAAGLLILLASPANYSRANQFDYIANFGNNMVTLFRQNTFMQVPFPFILMLSLCGVAVDYKDGKLKNKLGLLISAAVPLGFTLISALPVFNRRKLWIAATAVYVVQMFRLFVLRRYRCKPVLLTLAFIGFGSQIMLLVSPIWGWRCMLSMFIVHMLLIACCLFELDKKTQLFILCSGLTVSFHPLLTAAYWGVMLIFYIIKKEKAGGCVSQITLRAVVAAAMLTLLFGYAANAPTLRGNLERTLNHDGNTIILKDPPTGYSWYMFNYWQEKHFRILYNIPDDVEIVLEQVTENNGE